MRKVKRREVQFHKITSGRTGARISGLLASTLLFKFSGGIYDVDVKNSRFMLHILLTPREQPN